MTDSDSVTAAQSMDAEAARALFEREVPTIEALARSVCRRYGMDGDEADSFVSWVMVRILEDDVAVLRKFAGRSSLKTYLTVVVANLYKDHRVKKFGRWRPSAAARRLGHAGVLLDTYLNRKGHPLEEAINRLISRDDVEEDEATLREYAAQIPRREQRSFVSQEKAGVLPAESEADDPLLDEEADEVRNQVKAALERAMAELPDQDQLMVRLHFWEGLTIAAIARTLRVEQKPLYRRMEANLKRLRAGLQEQGVGQSHILEVLHV